MMKRKMLFFILIMACGFMIVPPMVEASGRIAATYVKTSDGDTARLIIDGENVRVRFLGINTPEVSGENKIEEPYGKEALEYTKNKLENAKKIEIEYDDVADHEDRFGRKLAWIWVDDALIEIELLEAGLAKTYMLKDGYRYAAELKEAVKEYEKRLDDVAVTMTYIREERLVYITIKGVIISTKEPYLFKSTLRVWK